MGACHSNHNFNIDGDDGMPELVEMPSGFSCATEDYIEVQKAFQGLTFSKELTDIWNNNPVKDPGMDGTWHFVLRRLSTFTIVDFYKTGNIQTKEALLVGWTPDGKLDKFVLQDTTVSKEVYLQLAHALKTYRLPTEKEELPMATLPEVSMEDVAAAFPVLVLKM